MGSYTDPIYQTATAFIWREGRPIDNLNYLLAGPRDWFLVEANGINDKGEIVGVAQKEGAKLGFLLRPINPAYLPPIPLPAVRR